MNSFYPKVAALLCGVLAFVLLNVSSLSAQSGPACLPDCFNSPFTPEGFLPPVDLAVPGQPDCFLRVTYGYRNACEIWHDFFIYNIELIGDCSDEKLGGINGIVQTATALLFMSNPSVSPSGAKVGPPQPPCGQLSCVTNWRVIKGTCWGNIGQNKYGPCQTTTCCLQPYQICRDYCNNITVTGGNASGGACSGQPGCVNVCQ